MGAPANPIETFISQFVQALQPPTSPQAQAVNLLFQEIVKPAFTAISEIVHTIEQYHPTIVQDLHLGDLGDFLHTLHDSYTAPSTSSTQFISDFSNELHKAWDFHL